MDNDDLTLEIFLRDRIKEKGISIKKLSETSGVSMSHIENMLRGDFERIPSMPYFRGYLIRLGEVLGFDGEEWWKRIKQEDNVRRSGPTDALPNNRFARRSPAKMVSLTALVLVVIIGFIVALPHIIGEPSISVVSPQGNPYVTSSDSITIEGIAKNADAVTINNDGATMDKTGTWQKTVLLQNGMNTFSVSAKKFLGGTASIVEQVLYNAPANSTATPSPSSTTSSTITASSTIFTTTTSAR
jgi:transcriptional regulator with XRE-family HTH domain